MPCAPPSSAAIRISWTRPAFATEYGPKPASRREGVLRRDVDEAAADALLPQHRAARRVSRKCAVRFTSRLRSQSASSSSSRRPVGGDPGVEDDGVEAAERSRRPCDDAVDDGGSVRSPATATVSGSSSLGARRRRCRRARDARRARRGRRATSRPMPEAAPVTSDDVAGELGRRRQQRQLVQLERPALEVVDLALG